MHFFQSAYLPGKSTETAITRITSIDHSILLSRISHIGIIGTAHKWLKSFISGRTSPIHIHTHSSSPQVLKHGVPQWSVIAICPRTYSIQYLHPFLTRHNLQYLTKLPYLCWWPTALSIVQWQPQRIPKHNIFCDRHNTYKLTVIQHLACIRPRKNRSPILTPTI